MNDPLMIGGCWFERSRELLDRVFGLSSARSEPRECQGPLPGLAQLPLEPAAAIHSFPLQREPQGAKAGGAVRGPHLGQ